MASVEVGGEEVREVMLQAMMAIKNTQWALNSLLSIKGSSRMNRDMATPT
jgi:hypothetical protein